MKKHFALALSLALFVACSNNSNDSFVNNFIAPKAMITYEQEMIVPQEYFFFKSIDMPDFVGKLQQKSLKKEITAYIPQSDIVCNDEDLQKRFRQEFSIDEMKSLIFEEEWAFDTAQFILKKRVNSYSLVRHFVRNSKYNFSDEPTKSIIASYNFPDNGFRSAIDKGFKLLAENVVYEVLLSNDENPEFLSGIQVQQVVKTIVGKATSNNVEHYSFMFRDSLQSISTAEACKLLGQDTECFEVENEDGSIDSVCVDNEIDLNSICGVVFIEDWYINEQTMEIRKDVKGVAPVRLVYRSDDTDFEAFQTIPFVMYLANHRQGK